MHHECGDQQGEDQQGSSGHDAECQHDSAARPAMAARISATLSR
jgi:hypothetical protein